VTRYLGLAEFFWLAEQVTGLDTTTLVKASRVELADSALHAPQAGYGDEDFYPDIYDKAAVLTCRLAWNHPLPDGNKRAAWACLLLFVVSTVDLGIQTHPTSKKLSGRCSMSRRARSTRSRSRVGSASGFDSLSSWPRCRACQRVLCGLDCELRTVHRPGRQVTSPFGMPSTTRIPPASAAESTPPTRSRPVCVAAFSANR
jgi:hypothetical protein